MLRSHHWRIPPANSTCTNRLMAYVCPLPPRSTRVAPHPPCLARPIVAEIGTPDKLFYNFWRRGFPVLCGCSGTPLSPVAGLKWVASTSIVPGHMAASPRRCSTAILLPVPTGPRPTAAADAAYMGVSSSWGPEYLPQFRRRSWRVAGGAA